MQYLTFYSYLSATIAYIIVLLLSCRRIQKNPKNITFVIAILCSIIWSGIVCYVATNENLLTEVTFPFESLRNISWFIFISILIANHQFENHYQVLFKSRFTYLILVLFCVILILESFPQLRYPIDLIVGRDLRLYIHISFAIIGLIMVEQLYRNATIEQHWSIKFLCLGLGTIFTLDFIIYSKSLLFTRLDFSLLNARGFVNAMIAPLLIISHNRLQNKTTEITVSRKVAFHSLMLFCTGLYLILMSIAGYYIRQFGGGWGEIAQILFIFLALLFILLLFLSGKTKAKVKVFINKHFFHYSYDYREEWIKLSKTVATLDSINELSIFIISTLADLVDSRGGELWSQNEQGDYYFSDLNNIQFKTRHIIPADSPCIQFMTQKKWIIDFEELKNDPKPYQGLDLSNWQADLNNIWLMIPLFQKNQITAFVILGHSKVKRQLNWEDHDLLETVSMQLSNALMLCHTSDELSRARQFEAYNRLSAFLVHDLKNLVAQVSMIVKNAEKHKHNPDFIDDSIDTLQNVNQKMQHLVEQLKKGDTHNELQSRTNLLEVILDAVKQQTAHSPQPETDLGSEACYVYAEKEKLSAILGHLIQNAQEATEDSGSVKIKLYKLAETAIIKISDTGTGMDKKFIAERLFKPFDTTKGNAGMGIGVYEARAYINKLAGKITVSSNLGQGTEFTITIPLGQSTTQSDKPQIHNTSVS